MVLVCLIGVCTCMFLWLWSFVKKRPNSIRASSSDLQRFGVESLSMQEYSELQDDYVTRKNEIKKSKQGVDLEMANSNEQLRRTDQRKSKAMDEDFDHKTSTIKQQSANLKATPPPQKPDPQQAIFDNSASSSQPTGLTPLTSHRQTQNSNSNFSSAAALSSRKLVSV